MDIEKSRYALVFALICLCGSGPLLAQPDERVIERFDRSSALPDRVAFQQFLGLIQPPPDSRDTADLRIVAHAVGLAADENGSLEHARPYADFFQGVHAAVQRELAFKANAILCTPNRSSRTIDEVGGALNAATDSALRTYEKYYRSTMRSLATPEREALQAYLDEIKRSTSYVRIDNQPGLEPMRNTLESECTHIRGELDNMGVSQ